MNPLTKTVLGVTSLFSKTNSASSPFEVLLEKGTDATKQKPYYTKVTIQYHDMIFKKRIQNLLKEKKLLLEYDFQEINKGTFLKPNRVLEANTSIKETMLSTTGAILVETLVPLPLQGMTHLSNEQVIKLKRINGHVFYFYNQGNRDSFQDSLLETLSQFLNKEYDKYTQINEQRSE
ncbi:hypothetical protein CVD28_03180 [Bacillus sp. M6-12]|uniref:hypothetical protein n=1 Tax=Bacillus sp. M6-12 TaxID=2054166 RepID=UPI000C780E0D|nr:hypothetical protein [Bacillus sp. M6-12]PLS19433.1 hypothetical protein CVD28_03180 [Bacillus sp. M6-12]